MLEQLRRIKNPLLRSAAIASFTFSIVTIVSGVAIAIVNPKDKSTSNFVVYSSLIGTAGGAVYGLIFAKSNSPKKEQWKDWRKFVVFRKVEESAEITSFYLQPQDKDTIANFEPGQFLTIKLDIPDRGKPIIRTYSLSDYNEACEYYRLSIKRESTPQGLDVPPGIASNYMHDRVRVGSLIEAKPPAGKFVLDVQSSLPAVLISNGVGITPMISMAKACSLLNPNRKVWFIHGARDGKYHAFRDEIMAIALQNSNLQVHYRYSRSRPEDDGSYHSVGYVDIDLIKQLVKSSTQVNIKCHNCGLDTHDRDAQYCKKCGEKLSNWVN
ncbi:MAG: FAD-binding oxidoreductase [Hydrococcus sp. Prado102]|nr:FAD-binding oxidoreductase [Hydrococcus sp. Prado102]